MLVSTRGTFRTMVVFLITRRPYLFADDICVSFFWVKTYLEKVIWEYLVVIA
jgi:hypothetical protein